MTDEVPEVRKITKHEFFFETPLYKEIDLNDFEDDYPFSGDVDGYSAKNNIPTTYSIKWKQIGESFTEYLEYFRITLTCKRKGNDDILRFFIFKDDNKAIKIWQDPSLATIQYGVIWKKYDKVLESKMLKELKKAIGLAAHGSGIGSFVHLRRIFEKLIYDCYDEYHKEIGIAKKDFMEKSMEDKVLLLKNYLPKQLVKMKKIYSILSLGIHELDEDICLGYYSGLMFCIELILDKKIELDLDKKRDEEAEKKIAQIEADVNKNKGK